jgi:fatty-acyl-CoA synthase
MVRSSISILIFVANAWNFPFVVVMNGSTVVLPGRDLSSANITNIILAEKVTFTAGVPTIW